MAVSPVEYLLILALFSMEFVQFFTTLPRSAVRNISIGCFDWDPIATFLPFPVLMVRQDAGQMIADAFAMIDSFDDEPAHTRVMVPTHLVEA